MRYFLKNKIEYIQFCSGVLRNPLYYIGIAMIAECSIGERSFPNVLKCVITKVKIALHWKVKAEHFFLIDRRCFRLAISVQVP